uniref:Venom S1 protease 27 n=1 Tax=Ectomocoris sp. TaxID=3104572 RepID=A0AB38ZEE8_9HEMI
MSPIVFLILTCYISITYGLLENYDIVLRVGQPYDKIVTPGYPDTPVPYNSIIQWNFIVETHSTIKVACNDIRMGQPGPWTDECEHIHLSFDDESGTTKVCGRNKGGHAFKSKGPKLTVKMVANEGSGHVQCTAYNSGEPEPTIINLEPTDGVQIIATPMTPVPNLDKMWILRSTPSSRISFQCSISLGNDKQCYKDILTIDNGEKVKKYCNDDNETFFTLKNYAKVRIMLNEFGDRQFKCIVQAVTGPNANQFQNIVDEDVDSSEFGVTPGRKSTTCDCGRANKTPARITRGDEAGENEFPWMVFLKIYSPINGGYSVSLCGASIITKRHVLTAAHCVVEYPGPVAARPEHIRMVFAEHNKHVTSGKEIEMEGEKLFIHENYIKHRTHDIAIIFTKDTIEFGPLIGPICLSPVQLPIINTRLQILGWGQTETGESSDFLRKSKATVIDRLLCSMAEWEICTHSKPSATCFGDSGGPQVWVDPETNRYTQVSLASKAHKDCYSGPNTQTDVQYFFNWIEDTIKKSDPSQLICQKIN